jgi:predicted enzyme related to lactoylglutathione lyase
VAFVSDPDENPLELVGMTPEIDVASLDKFAIGLTVSNVERSREFYGQVLGLAGYEPITPASLNGAKEYHFMARKTEIKFWPGSGDNLPKHTGVITDTMGFRYFTFLYFTFLVEDVAAAAAVFKARGAQIVLQPTDFGKIARIMVIADPDGNWIEFAALKPAR